MLPRGNITERHCRSLTQITNRTQQIDLATRADQEAWSARETEYHVNELLGKAVLESGDYKKAPAKDLYAGPPARRKTDKVKEEDPLTQLWLQLLYTTQVAIPGTWNVQYEGSGQWNFDVWAASDDPRQTLGNFFIRLGQALGGSIRWNPPSPQLDGVTAAGRMQTARLPTNEAEQSELYAAAQKSPSDFYSWVYGPDSAFAKDLQGINWQEMGVDDPVAKVRHLIDMLRTTQSNNSSADNP